MRALNLLERRVRRFSQEPPSVRAAAGAIVVTTLIVVVAAGALMRLLDGDEYPTIGLGMWWALQTVTTVGYGDAVPTSVLGRLLAALVMLEGIAFVAIVTAAVTSSFVARPGRRAREGGRDRPRADGGSSGRARSEARHPHSDASRIERDLRAHASSPILTEH
jgi:voltage-gated potassium channel